MDKEYLVKKWLNNALTDAEAKDFHAMEDAKLYEEIIEEAQRFNGNTNAKVGVFDALDKKLIHKKESSTPWVKVISGIAAIFVVGFALFTLLSKDKIRSFKTDFAQSETITLPDNSIVNLNQLSELEYNASSWNENRLIELDGEAYFDVEKGKRFDVNTKFGKVSVIGTEFNVLSRDSIFKVSCYKGLVQVVYGQENVKLPAGTELTLKSENAQKTSIVIAEPYWLKNMSVFENVSFKDVIAEFENRYKIKVDYPSEIHMNFTGAFEHNNLDNALKSITQPLNLTYSIQNNNEVIIRNVQN